MLTPPIPSVGFRSALAVATGVVLAMTACASEDLATGARPTDSTDSAPSNVVLCKLEISPVDGPTPQCECTSNGYPGTPTYEGSNCGNWFENYEVAPLICADANYPTTGTCSYYTEGPWTCSGSSLGCECEFTGKRADGATRISNCDNRAPNGGAWHCCLRGGECNCHNSVCADDQKEVSDCSTPTPLGLTAPPQSCPPDRKRVSSCDLSEVPTGPDGKCHGDYDCPGECDLGDIYACCPLCGSDGKCKMVCCGPGGCI
jgi:hypothetical protein